MNAPEENPCDTLDVEILLGHREAPTRIADRFFLIPLTLHGVRRWGNQTVVEQYQVMGMGDSPEPYWKPIQWADRAVAELLVK